MDDEKHDPLNLDTYKLKDTNSLVEEFMLLANCTVAKRIVEAYPQLAILRRHPTPDKYVFVLLDIKFIIFSNMIINRSRFENLVKVARHAGVRFE